MKDRKNGVIWNKDTFYNEPKKQSMKTRAACAVAAKSRKRIKILKN